jgi:hypothetical protein
LIRQAEVPTDLRHDDAQDGAIEVVDHRPAKEHGYNGPGETFLLR